MDINKYNEIVATINMLRKKNSVFEIRILKTTQQTVSGYFDNPETAVTAIEPYIGVNDIYITLNPPDAALLERSKNVLTTYARQTTADNNIEKFAWLLVDLDPIRKSGVSSTADEKREAGMLAVSIAKELREKFGFPTPIICDSGNGYHLLYKVELENTRENADILKNFLRALDFLYSTDKVTVDRSTYNAARIVKLHGTMACKGDNTDERPHRWSSVKKIPSEIVTLTLEAIRSVIAKLPKKDAYVLDADNQNQSKGIDIEKWLEDKEIEIAFSADFHNEGTKYILSVCPWRSEHTNKSAYVIQFNNGAIAAGCHHNSCQDENWHTLRDKYEPGWRDKVKTNAKSSTDETQVYDLNNNEKEIVHVTTSGWEIEQKVDNVFFYRQKTMSAQVLPIKKEIDLSILNKHYKYKNDDDKMLHTVSLITKFLMQIPHPIDVVHGEKGASKTTTLRKDKSLVDPASCDVLVMPKAKEDLSILLSRHYFSCFDNIGSISAETSNLLCMASTGGTLIKRKLYTDDDETILEFKQPVSLNGINIVATRPDLLDRSIILELDRLSPSERKPESILWDEFNKDKPIILGMIFTIISRAMNIVHSVEISELGRMADFTIWGYAIAEAAGLGGENFLNAYLNNQKKANNEAIDSHPIALAIVKFMNGQKAWSGSATELLRQLTIIAEREHIDTKSSLWAKLPNQLSRRLREVNSNLEQVGIVIEFSNSNGSRSVRIRSTDD